MDQSGYRELQWARCLADEAHQPRVRFYNELHLGQNDRFEFRLLLSVRWKRAGQSPHSLLSEGTEPRGFILQPRPSVQRVHQLSVAVWERAALRKRRHWRRGQADRRLAMEWKRPAC